MINLDGKSDWCLSGGATGSDLRWGAVAKTIGHGVIHFSFLGHRTLAAADELVVLTADQLAAADLHCHRANQTLHRRFPAQSAHVTNLLRRDWYQVSIAEACYAISTLEHPPGPTMPLGTVITAQVKGGTGWAVEMFKNRHDMQACPCYVFDQVLCHWFQWNGDGWKCIYRAPKPCGVYAAIGSRELLPMGKIAIDVTMKYDD